jgi:hypothetical protein
MDAPYIVEIDGVPVRCQTPEAAIALIRASAGGSGGGTHSAHRTSHQQSAQSNGNTRWTDQRVAEFFKLIEGKQRKLIDELLKYDDRTDEQLLTLLQLNNGPALGGVFSGLWKNAKKVGADPGEVYVKKPIMIGDRRGFEYALNPGFRQVAERRVAAAK